jgi:polar amino acid transport system substrate-binding protein
MKRTMYLLFLLVLLLSGGCGPQQAPVTSLSQLEGGKTFAASTGTVVDQFILNRFPDAKIEYYNSALDCAIAVKGGKADAAVYDLPIMKNICARQGGIYVLPELIEDDNYGFAVRLGDTLLKNAIDNTLAQLKADGTYDDMMKRWFPDAGAPEPMPDIPLPGTSGVLKFGTAAVTEPMAFYDASRKVVGFDIELAARVAAGMGRSLEITDMEFGGMLPALISGKVDMIGAGLSITAERAKKILYSQSYYPSGIAVVVKGTPPPTTAAASAAAGLLTSEDDLADKKIGVLVGSVYDGYATKKFPKATISQYQAVSDQLVALNSGKIDAVYADDSGIPDVLKSNPGLDVLVSGVFSIPIAAGFNSDNDALREQFNDFLKEIRANGVYNDMVDRWMTRSIEAMPDIPTPGTGGVLRAGVVNDLGMPFGIVKNGEIIGFDIELSKRFAAFTGRSYEPVPLAFGSLIASISTNKIDIITASMFATEEREKMIDFSDAYYESGASVLARRDRIGCSTAGLKGPEDLDGKRIGVITGTVFDPFVREKYPSAQVSRFDATTDMVLALSTGKVDAVLLDLTTSRLLVRRDPSLGILSDNILDMPLGMGFPKSNPGLREEFNAFLKEIRADGTYQKIYDRWFVSDANQAVMPEFPPVTGGKKLVIGTSVDDLPYVAFMNNDYAGIDIEILRTFAQRRGYDIEFVTMNFGSLIAALSAGKVDMISDGIAISEERRKMIDFSDPYVSFRTAVLALKKISHSSTDSRPCD